jgi:hypothetical protein
MPDASLRRDPAFPHLCPGPECAICRWLRLRALRAGQGVPLLREGEAPGGEDFAFRAKRLPGPIQPIVLTFDPEKP